ncbi:MAG: cyclic-di-AMP receptor [Thermomicrobiales bacterium]|nr:cyclic-di-AMP receptor [Thermomicrobiales bacterium]
MKLIVAVVQERDAEALTRALLARGFFFTQISSSGGFLRESNVTLMIGVQSHLTAEVLRILRQHSQSRTRYVNPLMPIVEPAEHHVASPVEVYVGGATVFVLPVERYERVA